MVILDFLPKSSSIRSEKEIFFVGDTNAIYSTQPIRKEFLLRDLGLAPDGFEADFRLLRSLVQGKTYSCSIYISNGAQIYYLFVLDSTKTEGIKRYTISYLPNISPNDADQFAILGDYLFYVPYNASSSIYYSEMSSSTPWIEIPNFVNTKDGQTGTTIKQSSIFGILGEYLVFCGGENDYQGYRFYQWDSERQTLTFRNNVTGDYISPIGIYGNYILKEDSLLYIFQGSYYSNRGYNIASQFRKNEENQQVLVNSGYFSLLSPTYTILQKKTYSKTRSTFYQNQLRTLFYKEEEQNVFLYSLDGFTFTKSNVTLGNLIHLQLSPTVNLVYSRNYIGEFHFTTGELYDLQASITSPKGILLLPGIPGVFFIEDVQNVDSRVIYYGSAMEKIPLFYPTGTILNGQKIEGKNIVYPENQQSLNIVLSKTPYNQKIYSYQKDHLLML